MRSKVLMVHINDIIRPRTGGQYAYWVMYDELRRNGYNVVNLSTPYLFDIMCRYWDNASIYLRNLMAGLAEIPVRFLCLILSILKLRDRQYVVVTSASPSFPVFGDITYHQPPVGIGFWSEKTKTTPRSLMIRFLEILSRPLWNFSKRTMIHISNSRYTASFVKKMYNVDTIILYPPVPLKKFLSIDLNHERNRWILVARLTYEGGALLLPAIARRLPRDVRLIVIGRIDNIGLQVLEYLKRIKVDFTYLGFVSEEVKKELLSKCVCFLHLGVNEPFGISVIEAMASGCIPIAHRSGAIQEYLPKDLTYVNLEEASSKLIKIVENPNRNELKELRKSLREKALCFDENIFRRKFMAIFRFVEETKLKL